MTKEELNYQASKFLVACAEYSAEQNKTGRASIQEAMDIANQALSNVALLGAVNLHSGVNHGN